MRTDNEHLHERIDRFAREVERQIQRGEAFIEDLPEFEQRSDRSKRLERFFADAPRVSGQP